MLWTNSSFLSFLKEWFFSIFWTELLLKCAFISLVSLSYFSFSSSGSLRYASAIFVISLSQLNWGFSFWKSLLTLFRNMKNGLLGFLSISCSVFFELWEVLFIWDSSLYLKIVPLFSCSLGFFLKFWLVTGETSLLFF